MLEYNGRGLGLVHKTLDPSCAPVVLIGLNKIVDYMKIQW